MGGIVIGCACGSSWERTINLDEMFQGKGWTKGRRGRWESWRKVKRCGGVSRSKFSIL